MAWEADLGGTLQGRSIVALHADVEADEDGIHRGDYLLLRDEAATPGTTVVAVVDGQLSLRRLVRGPCGERQLVPVNPHMLPLVLPAERARILGPLVGVLRKRRARRPTRASLPAGSIESDPTLHMMCEALADASAGASAGTRARRLARDLRSLRDCYVGTTVPRLRQALVREAQSCVARLRRALAAERRRSA